MGVKKAEGRGTVSIGWHQASRHTTPYCNVTRVTAGIRGWGQTGVPYQGLIGREEGGSTVIPTDRQQRHSAKLLTGKVGGGTAS